MSIPIQDIPAYPPPPSWENVQECSNSYGMSGIKKVSFAVLSASLTSAGKVSFNGILVLKLRYERHHPVPNIFTEILLAET